jgi:hypothetical protein
MKKILFIAISILVLASCGAPKPDSPINVEVDQYVITGFDKPKHVYVDLVRVSDGRSFEHVYVGKHCSGWESNFSIGDTISLHRYTYTDEGTDVIEFDREEINNCLCD